MIKHFYKRAAILFVAVAIFFSTSATSFCAGQIPSSVRVGLYYKDSSVNTALSIFNVSAASGLDIGFSQDNSFTEIYKECSPSMVYVRKDGFYYNDGDMLKEYNPTASSTSTSTIAANEKYGPYHIKIGNDFPDAATANAMVTAYRQLGVQAYIAYNDSWQVWVGSYVEEAAAQTDIINLKPAFGEIGYAIVPPSADAIVVVNVQGQPLCIYRSNTAYFQIKPAAENNPPVLNIKGKLYRGALEVRRLSGSDMTVINVVSIQEYLYGNVPAEIGGRSPAEAIKAQAVASKMYVINNMGKHARTGFDVCPTTSCQVYKGYSSEVEQCNHAIDAVKDKIITYENKPARQIYYFASSGGRTEDVCNVWGSSYPYLVSVEDKYEKIYTWTKTLRASDVRAKLPQLGNILGIDITKTAESGRVTQLSVRGESKRDPELYALERTRTLFSLDSQMYTINTDADVYIAATDASAANVLADSTAKDETVPLKTQLGGKKVITASGVVSLKASNNKATILGADSLTKKTTLIPETYTFTGKGWGHAVGMSQEGAIGMGKAGKKYDEIITHYFKGTKIDTD